MAAAKSTEKSNDKRRANLIMWKPGTSGNPEGKKLGTRNRKTVIMDAIKRMAEVNKCTPEDIEEMLHASGIEAAIKRGSFLHYAEISNGLYGKVTDKVDVTSGGKTLADIIAAASHERRKRKPKGD